jgi:hypothetical protein
MFASSRYSRLINKSFRPAIIRAKIPGIHEQTLKEPYGKSSRAAKDSGTGIQTALKKNI